MENTELQRIKSVKKMAGKMAVGKEHHWVGQMRSLVVELLLY
jgi:hypothetical protein